MDTDQAAEIAEAQPRAFPGIWVSIGWIILFFVLQLVAGVGAVVVALMITPGEGSALKRIQDPNLMALPTIWSLVISSLMLLGLLHLYLRKDDRYARIGLTRWSHISAIPTVFMGIAVCAIGIGFNFFYTGYVIPDVKVQEKMHALFAAIPDTFINNAFLLVAVAIIAPIVEEILFRGLLQNGLRKRMPAWAAIAIAGFIFAVVHADLYAMPALFVLGASFGFLYEKTGSLRVNIVMHMLNNGAAMLLSGAGN